MRTEAFQAASGSRYLTNLKLCPQVATEHNYEQSLFRRLQLGGQRVTMLTTQYRMHPAISELPARAFYEGVNRATV